MSDSRKQLERAFKLIKQDKLDEALEIITPILNAEPENVHAWWLRAYAVTEPRDVREALITVLRLDPNYANAPKARDMLEKLNQEYPPTSDELLRYPELQATFSDSFSDDLFQDDIFSSSAPFSEAETQAPFNQSFEDAFAPTDLPEVGDDFFTANDPFAEMETLSVPADTSKKAGKGKEGKKAAPSPRPVTFESSEALDDQTLAALEERAAKRQGRGRRLRFYLVTLVIILLGVVAAGYFGTKDEGDSKSEADPGELKVVTVETDAVTGAVQLAATELDTRLPGNAVVIAESDLGNTLFVKICGQIDPDLPNLINTGMEIAANQAEALKGQIPAVGVSIDNCAAKEHDTLYRAVVSVEDASRYREVGWPAFQEQWKKS